MSEPSGETLLGDLVNGDVVRFLNSTKPDELKKLIKDLRKLQEGIKEENGIIPWENGCVLTCRFISFSSHRLVSFRKSVFGKKDFSLLDAPVSSSSSTDAPLTREKMLEELERLETQNEQLMSTVKANKTVISSLKKQLKDSEIDVVMRMLSGRTFNVKSKTGKTVRQFRCDMRGVLGEDDSGFALVVDGSVMNNLNKQLQTYGISHGSIVDLIRINTRGDDYNPPDETLFEAKATDGAEVLVELHKDEIRHKKYVIILIPRLGETTRIKFWFNDDTDGSRLYNMLSDYTGIAVDDYQLFWHNTDSVVEDFDRLASYFSTGSLLRLVPKLRGGVLTRHLKRDEAVAKLKSRVSSKVQDLMKKSENAMDLEDSTNASTNVLDYLALFEEKMNKLKVLKAEGIPVIKLGLSKLTLSQLNDIEKISNGGSRNGITEERLYKMLDMMYPDLVALDHSIVAIKNAKKQAVVNLMAIFTEEYVNYSPSHGSATLDIPQFRKDLEYVKRSHAPTNVDEAVVNSCVVAWDSIWRVSWQNMVYFNLKCIHPRLWGPPIPRIQKLGTTHPKNPKTGDDPSQMLGMTHPKSWGRFIWVSFFAVLQSLSVPDRALKWLASHTNFRPWWLKRAIFGSFVQPEPWQSDTFPASVKSYHGTECLHPPPCQVSDFIKIVIERMCKLLLQNVYVASLVYFRGLLKIIGGLSQ